MANLKEVRGRIASVRSIQQITKAMKMVSAAKLKRASDAILELRPYAVKLKELIEKLSSHLEDVSSPYSMIRPVKNVLIIPITSNRGQAGAFNTNVIRATINHISSEYSSIDKNTNLHILSIGRKGSDYFSRRNFKIEGIHNDIYNTLHFDEVGKLADEVMKGFEDGKWDKVDIIYNQFKNAAVQVLETEQLLPVQSANSTEKQGSLSTTEIPYYIYEPSQEEIVRDLIPEAIRTQLFKALLDSHAAEHGARMTSMEKATDNAGELLKTYRLLYNRARQAAITTEILEIVSGANALAES